MQVKMKSGMSGAQVFWQEQGPTLVDDDDLSCSRRLSSPSHICKGPHGRPFCQTVSQFPALRIPA